MAVIAKPGAHLEIPFDNAINGVLGVAGWELFDNAAVLIPRTTTGVTNPVPGYFVVSLTLPDPLAGGEYQLRFDDGLDPLNDPPGMAEVETIVVDVDDPLSPSWAPSVSSVAALIRTRTRQPESRNELAVMDHDTFTNFSRPTYPQVAELIRIAIGDVYSATGGREPCTELLEQSAGSAARYRAAQLAEASYFSEQTNSDQTAFSAFADLAAGALEALGVNVKGVCPAPGYPGVDGLSLFAGKTPKRTLVGPGNHEQMVLW